MQYLTPWDIRRRRVKRLWAAAGLSLGFLILTVLDRRIYFALRLEHWEQWQFRDWEQALRTTGYLPTWIAAGLIVRLSVPRWRPGEPLSSAPLPIRSLAHALPWAAVVSGLFAELCKVILLRHRPTVATDGEYLFDWFGGAYAGRGLGLASSHAAVAFGAAFLLWRYSRPAGWLAIALAMGCAITRLLAGAHFITDVYVAAILAWLGSGLVWRIARAETENKRI